MRSRERSRIVVADLPDETSRIDYQKHLRHLRSTGQLPADTPAMRRAGADALVASPGIVAEQFVEAVYRAMVANVK